MVVRCEHQQGTTPAATNTRDPIWPADGSDFTFAITEITSDVVLTVLDRDPLLGDQVAGEVCVPLQLLLAPTGGAALTALAGPGLACRIADAARSIGALQALRGNAAADTGGESDVGDNFQDDVSVASDMDGPEEDNACDGDDWVAGVTPRWALILPRRAPGEALQRVRPRPEKPLGALCFSIYLELDCSSAFAYAAPDVMPPEVPAGRDASADFSLAALSISLGGMLDGIFMPMFAPCRTLLYLQSWQAPAMNIALIIALWIGTMHAWFLMRALAPLWLALWPVFNGYISYLIRRDDYTPLYSEDAAEEARARSSDAEAQARRDALLADAQARALAAARAAADPATAAAAASAGLGIGGAISSTLGGLFSSSSGGDESAVAMSAYKRIKSKLEYAHVCGLYYAVMFDTWCNLFTWKDRALSATVAVAFAALGLAASVALTTVALLGAAVGLGVRHVVLAAGLACFYPAPAAMRLVRECVRFSFFRCLRACAHLPLHRSSLSRRITTCHTFP